jgi:hypothetical protein
MVVQIPEVVTVAMLRCLPVDKKNGSPHRGLDGEVLRIGRSKRLPVLSDQQQAECRSPGCVLLELKWDM